MTTELENSSNPSPSKYADLTVEELREKAKTRKIKGYSLMTKGALIGAHEAFDTTKATAKAERKEGKDKPEQAYLVTLKGLETSIETTNKTEGDNVIVGLRAAKRTAMDYLKSEALKMRRAAKEIRAHRRVIRKFKG